MRLQVDIVLLISYWMEVRLTRDFSQSDLDYLFVRTITHDTVFQKAKRMELCIPDTLAESLHNTIV
jgi:hypothetical protein